MPDPYRSFAGAAARLVLLFALATPSAPALHAQELDDRARLTGVTAVSLRATAVWDELITTTAGGATGAQFEEALLQGLEMAIRGAEAGPAVEDEAPGAVRCHVDTFYDSGLIVYSVIASYERPDASGAPVIAWMESRVGSYTAQQLHLIWTLADQCAEAFLEDWVAANG